LRVRVILHFMAAHPCHYLYNCVKTTLAENAEMIISQDLRKRIVTLSEKRATVYAIENS
jgi:hypothetical protein